MNALSFHSCISFCTAHVSSSLLYSYFIHVFIHKLCHHLKDCSILVSVTSWRSAWYSWPEALVVVWCSWHCWYRIFCTSTALPALLFLAGALFCIISGIEWILSIWILAKSKMPFLNNSYIFDIQQVLETIYMFLRDITRSLFSPLFFTHSSLWAFGNIVLACCTSSFIWEKKGC